MCALVYILHHPKAEELVLYTVTTILEHGCFDALSSNWHIGDQRLQDEAAKSAMFSSPPFSSTLSMSAMIRIRAPIINRAMRSMGGTIFFADMLT